MEKDLKLVTRYDAGRNEYTVYRHNLTIDEANESVRELAARLFGLFVVSQQDEHVADHAEACPACREDVEQNARVEPKPRFTRRSK